MKTLIAIVLVALFCVPVISAIEKGPITIGKTTQPWTPPPKNPQDCDALFKNSDYENAIQCYDNTTKLIPNDAKTCFNKGIALYQLNRFDEAIVCFEKVIQLQPSCVEAWNNKGLALSHVLLKCAVYTDDNYLYQEPIKCIP